MEIKLEILIYFNNKLLKRVLIYGWRSNQSRSYVIKTIDIINLNPSRTIVQLEA